MYNIFVRFLLILTVSQVISYNSWVWKRYVVNYLTSMREIRTIIFHIGDQYIDYVSTSKVTRGCIFKHKLLNNIKLCNQSQIENLDLDFKWVHS